MSFNHAARKAEYGRFCRELWGGSGRGHRQVGGGWAKPYGRIFEQVARETILPAEGFTEVDDWSEWSNQFLVDFIATWNGERVLVDITAKISAYVPAKKRLARSLRMRLFILHVSPREPTTYWLAEPEGPTSKVPASVLHKLHSNLGPIEGWPYPRDGQRVLRVTVACEICGVEHQVVPSKAQRSRFCSDECRSEARRRGVYRRISQDQYAERVRTGMARAKEAGKHVGRPPKEQAA